MVLALDSIVPAELASEPQVTTRQRSQSSAAPTPAQFMASPIDLPSEALGSAVKARAVSRALWMTMARRTLGISLLLLTVFLWTLSNFLASSIFSDNTYDKPFFLVYLNTCIFAISLIPMGLRFIHDHGLIGAEREVAKFWREYRYGNTVASLKGHTCSDIGSRTPLTSNDDVDDYNDASPENANLLSHQESGPLSPLEIATPTTTNTSTPMPGASSPGATQPKLSLRETARLSLEFCMLWFAANYFSSACLEYTTVSSATILSSTSSVWTLLLGALLGVEVFSLRKLVGVLASLAGVMLVSSVDLAGGRDDDDARGSFPHKSAGQIAIGDAMAFLSAIIYGLYITVMKRKVGSEDRVHMPLFFGLVGLFNLTLLWPGFLLLHVTGIEPFVMPPTRHIWSIIIINSLSSFVSDIAWAYAMLLTTPLVVTVGLSLTIPLSLVGEMIQYSQYLGWLYWVGAGVVLLSFLFINHESRENGDSG